tara:strand:- start:1606 stop:2511 length:906 start_codon:yes stop_codon:yes gene_type:complete
VARKVLLNRKPVEGPWGGGNLLVTSLCNLMPSHGWEVVHELTPDVDVIFMQDPRPGNTGISINEITQFKAFKPGVKIIHRVNECDARKGTMGMNELLQECSRHTDLTVFVSEWMRDYHTSRGWHTTNTHVIYNGADPDHFRPSQKIDNGKVNIVTHHWSNNRMKGFDVYEAIDDFVGNNDGYTFTYIGRENGTFSHTNIIEPLFGRELGAELGRYDVYVTGSRFDPGPNHVLESIACNIPTYALASGGGACEMVGPDHVFDSIENLLEILRIKDFKHNSTRTQNWQACISAYAQIMGEMLG